jgi:hypothetical protein
VDEFGNPAWEVARDEHGVPILVGGQPIIVGPLMVTKMFRYYEIIPPPKYRTAIDGQPAVNLYIGTEEVLEFQERSISSLRATDRYVRPEDSVFPDYELVYAKLVKNSGAAELVNPLAVISDLQTDQNGHLTKRLRGLFYKKDNADRRYPMLFEVEVLPYGYCLEVGNAKHHDGTEHDQGAPYYLREQYAIERTKRRRGQKGYTLQLTSTKCFKHRLEVPVLVKK